jgi:hypothetical protein
VIGWPSHEFRKSTICHETCNCHVRTNRLLSSHAPEAGSASQDGVDSDAVTYGEVIDTLSQFGDMS